MIEWKVAKEITLAMFHADDQMRAIDIAQGSLQSIAMPNQITDAVSTHGPCAENERAIFAFKNRQQAQQQSIRLRGTFHMQVGEQWIAHVFAIALANAQHNARELGKIAQCRFDHLTKIRFRRIIITRQFMSDGRSHRYGIDGEIDSQAMRADDGK